MYRGLLARFKVFVVKRIYRLVTAAVYEAVYDSVSLSRSQVLSRSQGTEGSMHYLDVSRLIGEIAAMRGEALLLRKIIAAGVDSRDDKFEDKLSQIASSIEEIEMLIDQTSLSLSKLSAEIIKHG